jgi:CRP-like cAMP-binding protein
MKSSYAHMIASCPLFSKLRCDVLEHVGSAAVERHLAPRRSLVSQGEPFPYLGVVVDGSIVAIAASAAGREQLLYEAMPNDTFGEIPMLDDGSTLAYFAAGERGAISLLIPRSVLDFVCRSDPALSIRLAQAAAHRARILTERLSELAFVSTTSRIARAIASFLPADITDASRATWVEAPIGLRRLSQAKIGRLAGTVRVVVARVLGALAMADAISLRAGRVTRINLPELARWL